MTEKTAVANEARNLAGHPRSATEINRRVTSAISIGDAPKTLGIASNDS